MVLPNLLETFIKLKTCRYAVTIFVVNTELLCCTHLAKNLSILAGDLVLSCNTTMKPEAELANSSEVEVFGEAS